MVAEILPGIPLLNGQRLVDAGAVCVARLNGVRAVVFDDDVFIVVGVGRQGSANLLFNAPSKRVVNIVDGRAASNNLRQAVFIVVGIGGDGKICDLYKEAAVKLQILFVRRQV